jgi:hypothetical protein
MKSFFVAASLVFIGTSVFSGSALAQAASDCTCLSAPVASPGKVINTASGVSYSGPQGPQTVVPGTPVNLSTQPLTSGPSGGLGGQFGTSCTWSAGPSSIVSVSQIAGGQLCLQISEIEPVWPLAAEAAFVAGVSGLLLIPFIDNDDNNRPVSGP